MPGKHLLLDRVITTFYTNNYMQTITPIPGYVANQAEDWKLYADIASTSRVPITHGCPQ